MAGNDLYRQKKEKLFALLLGDCELSHEDSNLDRQNQKL